MKKMTALFATLLCGVACIQLQAQGLFWKISGNGLENPSYVYGTMHTSDERVFDFQDGVIEALESVDHVALELNMDSINQMKVAQMLVMDDGSTLKSLLDEEEYKIVEDFFRDSLQMPLEMMQSMQPMYLTSIISQRNLQEQVDGTALDMWFAVKAKEKEIGVIGLEKMEEQVGAFRSIPYEKQAEMLVESITDLDGGDDKMDELLDAYIKGDLQKLLELTTESDDIPEGFEEVFLTKRNINMADRADKYLQDGKSLFIAVGAAHLPGEQGVLELFRKKGYAVEAYK